MARCRYDLIALDLDGTLFGPDGRVSDASRAAIDEARAEGVEVVICTGRGFIESTSAVRAIDADQPARGREIAPMVCAGGAMVVDAATGGTLHRWPMREELVRRLCGHFAASGRAPIVLKDRDAAGYDYLFVRSGPMEPPTRWWFDVMDVVVREIDHIDHDEHPEHTVRVGFAAVAQDMTDLAHSVRTNFEHETMLQHFGAVAGTKDSGSRGVKDDTIQLLEVFDPQVSKWTAIHRLALEQGIDRERIAAVGDEVNDVAMIEGAGLGVAMANAVDAVREVADVMTHSNAEDGVAHAIRQMLAGVW